MKALGLILAGGNNNRMRELSNKRAIAAMPVGGSFRCIDFALSNMSNSHIQKVAVLTQYNARSLTGTFKFFKMVGSEENREDSMSLHQRLHRITAGGIVERQMRFTETLIS